MGKKSSLRCQINSPKGELFLKLTQFERYSDDSSILFKLDLQSSYFSIRNYEFYAEYNSFVNFLPAIQKGYDTLTGSAEISQTYEDQFLKFRFRTNGQVDISGYANYIGENARVEITIDQTYLPDFIEDLKTVYMELGLS